jgi:hypothetical protein
VARVQPLGRPRIVFLACLGTHGRGVLERAAGAQSADGGWTDIERPNAEEITDSSLVGS